jgi:hypothetical protein
MNRAALLLGFLLCAGGLRGQVGIASAVPEGDQAEIRTALQDLRPGAPVFGASAGERVTVFVDFDGVVRRVIRGGDRAQHRARVVEDFALWRHGAQIYASQCARCHGPDGNQASYPGVKPLAGLGLRKTEAEIRTAFERTGAVDLSSLTDRDRRAVILFTSGL